MLHVHPDPAESHARLEQASWIDLVDPTYSDVAEVQRRFGLNVPSRADLDRIEASSRLNARGDVLTMSAPLISGSEAGRWEVAPVGFVLAPGS